ncbi:MAG TPA: aminoglycoside adenylyltransferase domain-containing protein [Gaiellaceae bacterium]
MTPRDAVAQLAALLQRDFGNDLVGLYLFGSLAAGGFHDGKSDVDLLAVLRRDLADGDELERLRGLHARFVAERPEWVERIEVGYVSLAVLQTLAGERRGTIGAISPGEPLNVKEIDDGWLLNWASVCDAGETILGPPPLELAPVVTPEAWRAAVERQLEEWREHVRQPWVAYVPTQHGYTIATVSRALCALETGRQVSKAEAVEWAAQRFPEEAAFIRETFARYRSDLREPHRRTIAFVDRVADAAARSA